MFCLSYCSVLATIYVRFKEVDTIAGLPSTQINGLNKVSAVLGVAATLGMSVVANFQVSRLATRQSLDNPSILSA